MGGLCPTTAGAPADKTVELTLSSAVHLALRSNRSLISGRFGRESQALSLTAARAEFETQYGPSITAGVADNREQAGAGMTIEKRFETGASARLRPAVGRSASGYSSEARAMLTVPLSSGYGRAVNLDGVRSAAFSVRTAERALLLNKVSVVIDTVAAVYDIARLDQLAAFYRNELEKTETHVRSAEIKADVGLAGRFDVLRAEIRKNELENSLAGAFEDRQNAADRLKLILAMPLERRIRVNVPFECEPVAIPVQRALETAYANRVELMQLVEELEESRRRSVVAKRRTLPGLNLVADYTRFDAADQWEDSLALAEDRWSLFLEGTMDARRTREKSTFAQSLLRIRSVRLNQRLKRDEIAREVRRQMAALENARQRIDIRMEQIHKAEGKRALAQLKFDHGMADNFNVIEAETQLQSANVALIGARTDYIVGVFRLRQAMGTLLAFISPAAAGDAAADIDQENPAWSGNGM